MFDKKFGKVLLMNNSGLKLRIAHFWTYFSRLKELQKKSEKEFLENFLISDSVERNFQLVIEALTDLGNHIIKRENLGTVESRSTIFQILCQNRILPLELEEKLVSMVKFRNLLVHQYTIIDKRLVYKILQENLKTIATVAETLINKIEELNDQ